MCAITGKITFGRESRSPRDTVLAMTEALAHRGPGGLAFHFGPGAGIGHRHCDAEDGPSNRQPASNEDDTVLAALDGEIVNASALRAELSDRGHTFRTETDAEVLAHGYEQWGELTVERLRGPFAFVVWDERRRRALLGRDRLGIRPLHYAVLDGGVLVFASEIRALLEDPQVPRDWDAAAVKEYLTLGYVPSPATIFSRIVKLPAGHFLLAEHRRVRVTRYWDLPLRDERQQLTDREYMDRLDGLLADAVQANTRGDQPVVAMLSSGVDAAAVVGYAGQGEAPLVTTTTAFDEPPFDEVDRTRAIAKHLGTRHYTDLITPNLAQVVARLALLFDEPIGDPATVTSYYSTLSASERGSVVLSSAGSDEIWGRSAPQRLERIEAQARRWLGPLRLTGVIAPVLPVPTQVVQSARRLAVSPAEGYARKHNLLSFPRAADRLFTTEFAERTAGVDPLATLRELHGRPGPRGALDRALYVDVKTYLADNVLTRLDRIAASTSSIVRVPMLDHEVVEFAATVPSSLRVRGNTPSDLLRRVTERRVPGKLLEPSMHRFEPQAAAWLRGPLASMVSDVLLSGRLRQRGIFDPRAVTHTWQQHLTGRRDCHQPLWALLMLELWFQQFVDRPVRRPHAA